MSRLDKIPHVKDTIGDIIVNSTRRKKKQFFIRQIASGKSLIIDGKYVCKTHKGFVYDFHIVDGKIDHWERISPKEIALWNIDEFEYEPPEYWCDECIIEEESNDPLDIPF